MTVAEFFAKYNGQLVDYDGVYGAQCYDLFQFYNRDVINAPFVSGQYAKDIWSNFPVSFYLAIPNTPTNAPSLGDVVVWGSNFNGGMGHVGIATEKCTDAILEVLEQNDPTGSPSHVKTYNYDNVIGWIHPRAFSGTQTTEVTPTVEQVQGQLKTQVEATSQCLTQLKTAQDQVTTVQGQLSDEQEKNKDLTGKLADLQLKYDNAAKEIITINGSLADLASSNKEYAQDALDNEHLASYRLTLLESIANSQEIKIAGLADADIAEKILAQNQADKTLMQAQHEKIQALQKIKLVTPQVVGDIKKNYISMSIRFLREFMFGNG